MSGPHPTISAWQREEREGYFEAELHDWKLRVNWSARSKDSSGGFSWEAKREGNKTLESDRLFEEPELAMADAEHAAKLDAEKRTAEVAKLKDGDDDD
ncbi:MAG: hypothetical protein DRI90_03775 [Deltaproteobacteria bacterium]|nr:MAG: hypothetical protein DRI90_03775 [Deltaproteobacteria bacterium]